MKLKQKLAEEWSHPDKHDWHSCNGISMHPIREKAFIAGFEKCREVILGKRELLLDIDQYKMVKEIGEEEVS